MWRLILHALCSSLTDPSGTLASACALLPGHLAQGIKVAMAAVRGFPLLLGEGDGGAGHIEGHSIVCRDGSACDGVLKMGEAGAVR